MQGSIEPGPQGSDDPRDARPQPGAGLGVGEHRVEVECLENLTTVLPLAIAREVLPQQTLGMTDLLDIAVMGSKAEPFPAPCAPTASAM